MKELTMKISWMKIAINTIIIVLTILILEQIVIPNINGYLPKLIENIIFVDFNDLGTIWAIQSTIAAVSITIVSLIIGSINTKKYGFSITEAMMIDDFKIKNKYLNIIKLKYWDMVILTIMLSIVDIYFVTHDDLMGTSILFFISGSLIVIILSQTLKIMLNYSVYKSDEIKEYILENIKLYIKNGKKVVSRLDEDINQRESAQKLILIIEKVYVHSIELISKKEIEPLMDNIDFYIQIISKKTYNYKDETSVKSEEISETIQMHILSICKELIKNNMISKVKLVINKILKIKEDIYESDRLVGRIIVVVVDNMKYLKELESLEEYQGLYDYILKYITDDINENTENKDSLDVKTISILEKIYINSLELLKLNYLNQSNKNIDLFIKLLDEKEYSKNEELVQLYFDTKISNLNEKITSYIYSLCEIMIDNHNIEEIKIIINKILDTKNNVDSSEFIVRNILIKLVDSIKYINDIRKIDTYKIYEYVYKLHIEEAIKIEILQKYYYILKHNFYLNKVECTEVINKLIEFIAQNYFIDTLKIKENLNCSTINVCREVILYIGRESILKIYDNDLIELINRLCKHCRLIDNREYNLDYIDDEIYLWNVNEIFAILNAYIYYLLSDEDDTNKEFKAQLSKLLHIHVKDQSSNTNSLKYLTQVSKGEYLFYYDSIEKTINSLTWEFMQLNKIKDTKIESSIKNYFIYYATVFINDVNGSKYLENIKKLNEIYNLELWLEYFDDDGQLINIDKVVGFCDIYNIEYNEKYNGEILYSYLKEKRANMCNLTI